MMDIDSLAQDLQRAMASVTVTMQELRELIQQRKVSALISLLGDAQKANINKMFYYYDERGHKQVTNTKIMFDDYEYIVVRSEKYSPNSQKIYHAVWVLGVENGKPWLHRLPWNQDFENEAFTWTAEYVRKCMGFSVSTAEPYTFELNKTVRVQGDLTITLTQTWDSYVEILRDKIVDKATWKCWTKFQDSVIDEVRKEVDADIAVAKKAYQESDYQVLRGLKAKYGLKCRFANTATEIGFVGYELLVKREAEKRNYYVMEAQAKQEAENYAKIQPAITKQINFRIGNHVITVKDAMESDLEHLPCIVVPKKATLVAVHDEHGQTVLSLNSGVYRLNLLDRHRTDVNVHGRR